VKKLLALFLVVGVVCVSLSGCDSGSTTVTKATGPGGGGATTAASKP
jgi:hypothetical protein